MEWHELPKYNGIQVSQLIYDSHRRDVPVGVPLDLSTPTGMSCQNQNSLPMKRQNDNTSPGIGLGMKPKV